MKTPLLVGAGVELLWDSDARELAFNHEGIQHPLITDTNFPEASLRLEYVPTSPPARAIVMNPGDVISEIRIQVSQAFDGDAALIALDGLDETLRVPLTHPGEYQTLQTLSNLTLEFDSDGSTEGLATVICTKLSPENLS
jgi:hypothetical protein